jgi:hypothetical protein
VALASLNVRLRHKADMPVVTAAALSPFRQMINLVFELCIIDTKKDSTVPLLACRTPGQTRNGKARYGTIYSLVGCFFCFLRIFHDVAFD